MELPRGCLKRARGELAWVDKPKLTGHSIDEADCEPVARLVLPGAQGATRLTVNSRGEDTHPSRHRYQTSLRVGKVRTSRTTNVRVDPVLILYDKTQVASST